MATQAQSAPERHTHRSVPELLLERIAATPDRPAYQQPEGDSWRTLTWREVGERVRAIASGLTALGLAAEERCAILSGTRVEWVLADLAILCAGGATTTVYPSSTAEECAFILRDSASAFVFAENDEQVGKLVARRAELPAVRRVIVIDGAAGHDGWVITLSDLMARGREHDPAEFERVARGVRPEALATLMYTSGTTGRPKGVELTHDNWVYEGEAIDALGLLAPEDRQFLWLPLAHSFGKVLEVAQLRIGFSTAIDGRLDRLVENLAAVRPSFVAAVPRVFEKVHNKVVTGVTEAGGLKSAIFSWAMGVGAACSALVQRGERPRGWLAAQRAVADRLVFGKLRQRFGGRLRFFISGSAPLSREIAEFFHAAGILILEGYGLTESSAANFVNRPERYRFGTVGLPLPGTEVRIADDGEVLLKSRGVMRGYHGLSADTGEALEDGWLRTGDVGAVDEHGFLKITDRKKDLIKTSGGKYVAPQLLEGRLKALCPYVSQVLVHGDRRNFCTALVTLDEEALRKWAADHGHAGTYAELAALPETSALIQPYVDELNATLPSYATIKKFALLEADLSLESGDLTTSLKLKRKAVERKYMGVLDRLYEQDGREAAASHAGPDPRQP
jgi:long-chain acyl-CoA synthetase